MEKLLTVQDVADVLGLSMSTITAWAKAGKIPAIKLGHVWRFRLAEVEEWLSTLRVESGGLLEPTRYKKGKWHGPVDENGKQINKRRKIRVATSPVQGEVPVKEVIIKDEYGNPVMVNIPEVDMTGIDEGDE